MRNSKRILTIAAMASAALTAVPAFAGGYTLTNLVANKQIYQAPIIDKDMVNAWGIAIRPAGAGGHFWINNTDTGTVSLYIGDVGKVALHQDDTKLLHIAPPKGSEEEHGAPTGQVFNGRDDEFVVTLDGITGPSKFIFDTEEGTIIGWTEKKNEDGSFIRPTGTVVMADNSKAGAIYKGLAISQGLEHNMLYAADFGRNRIDVFDASFKQLKLEDGFKRPQSVPQGYAPFNIQELGGRLYVTYARLTKEPGEEEQGNGLGYLAAFDFNGELVQEFEGGKDLDAPWGLAIAPEDFGEASGRLLVGNFGDGRIVTFDLKTGKQEGVLKRPDGTDLEIEGLWGLVFGNGQSLGEKNHLYFTAGPADEADGVFGKVVAAP